MMGRKKKTEDIKEELSRDNPMPPPPPPSDRMEQQEAYEKQKEEKPQQTFRDWFVNANEGVREWYLLEQLALIHDELVKIRKEE